MIRLILIFIFSLNLYASDDLAYHKFSPNSDQKLTNELILDSGRTRSQDGFSNCYIFSFAKGLENICRISKDCQLDGEEVSTLAIMKKTNAGINTSMHYVGGTTQDLLDKFPEHKTKGVRLPKESCAPYTQLLHKVMIDEHQYYYNENNGMNLLSEIHLEVSRLECIDCSVKQQATKIKDNLKNLKLEISEIEAILASNRNNTFDQFASELLLENKCKSHPNLISIPPFKKKNASTNEIRSFENFISTTIKLLNKGITPQLSHCSGFQDSQGNWHCGRHAVIIDGYKKYCNTKRECSYSVKVKNSWGQDWQNSNNDGWIDAMKLHQYAIGEPINKTETKENKANYSNAMTWLEPLQIDPNKLPIVRPDKTLNSKKQIQTNEKITNQSTQSLEELKEFIKNNPETNWMCKKKGKTTGFTDSANVLSYATQGYNCTKF
jgi:hypothetical protein